jgi:hypothetical protein
MNFCTNCGAELGVGRFCTNCGAPISGELPADFPGTGALRPPVTPEPPASPSGATTVGPVVAAETSASSRYPLYADQAVLAPLARKLTPTPPARRHASERSWWLPILLLFLAMLAAASAGIWLATRGSDDPDGVSATPDPSSPVSTTPPEKTKDPSPTVRPDGRSDLAPLAEAEGPPPVPPGLDLSNNRVTYPVTNLLDENPESAYRIPGDATDSVITFRLPETSTITEVGLVNGYAKTDRDIDWYELNRRIVRVEWRFDDGTSVVQDLESTREMQLLEVDPVKTGTIELTILEVTAPGPGRLGKNVTAISDVLILGS